MLPPAPAGPRAHHAASGCAAGSASRWPGPASSRCAPGRSSAPADFDRLGLPADDVRRDTIRVANPLSEEAPLLTTTLLPGLLETTARNLGRGRDSVGIFETAPVFFPTPDRLAAPRSWRSTAAPTTTSWPGCWRRSRGSRCTLAVVLAGDRQAVRLVGPGPPGVLGRRRRRSVRERGPACCRVDVEVRPGGPRMPWHPGRCAGCWSTGR